eukprot:TRINITY_DN2600_c0_g1_i2.p1 TRINITY_DN2600_c0_g1~~TRINITY_DN2600_c0_g1_i2.p1  ORF type:complete len:239 (-),score=71.62 TRINITY_DN2600_c0_g1_i2:3-719(-)
MLSPPRADPFAKVTESKDDLTNGYTYAMTQTKIEKDQAELVKKIQDKKKLEKEERESEINQKRMERKELLKKQRKAEKKAKKSEKKKRKNPDAESSPDSSPPLPQPEKKEAETSLPIKAKKSRWEEDDEDLWTIEVLKDKTVTETLHLNKDITYTFGRGDNVNIRTNHQSCSKLHAQLSFISQRPNIMDMQSTNGTSVNGEAITPNVWKKLKSGDVVVFAFSTRSYVLKVKEKPKSKG